MNRCLACGREHYSGDRAAVVRAVSGFLTVSQVQQASKAVGGPVDEVCPDCLVRAMAEAV